MFLTNLDNGVGYNIRMMKPNFKKMYLISEEKFNVLRNNISHANSYSTNKHLASNSLPNTAVNTQTL